MPTYVMEIRRRFKEAYAEAHLQMNCEAEKQKWYYDQAMSTMQLVPGDVVLMKNDMYQGNGKSRTGGVRLSMLLSTKSQMVYQHMK